MSIQSRLFSRKSSRYRTRKAARRRSPVVSARTALFEPLEDRRLLATTSLLFDVDDATTNNTQAGWTPVNVSGINGVTFTPVGGSFIDQRDRGTLNTDGPGGDVSHNDMWRDFIFGDDRPEGSQIGDGLDIRVAGLEPNATYNVRLWAFDESSNGGRNMTWNGSAILSIPDSPDPTSLNDQVTLFSATADGAGTLLMEGRVAAPINNPCCQVFVNGFELTKIPGDDEYATNEDTAFSVGAPGVLVNDASFEGGLVAVESLDTSATLGTATLSSDGSFTYDPNGQFESLAAGQVATDTFKYTTVDENELRGTATVTITITGVNDGPVAVADQYNTDVFTLLVTSDVDTTPRDNFGDSLDGHTNNDSVLVNDTDVDTNDVLSVTTTGVIVTALGATVTMNADGTFSYNATTSDTLLNLAGGATMDDTFSYTMTDGNGEFDTATVTVTVTGANANSVHIVDCPCDGGTTKALVVKGSSLDDKIDVKLGSMGAEGGVFKIKIKTGSMAGSGTSMGTFKFEETINPADYEAVISKIVIYGLDGNDDIKIHGDIEGLRGFLFGGEGDDKIKGGKSADVLVGGPGDDKLDGHQARDIVIGGTGADKIKGNQDEDILIAGATDYDNNLPALCAIMDEWTRTDNTFEDRVNNVFDGSGAGGALNGPYTLENHVQLSDGAQDDLKGGGSGTDWFILSEADGDKSDKLQDGEAFWSDEEALFFES